MMNPYVQRAFAQLKLRPRRAARARVALEFRPDAIAAVRVESGVPVRGDCVPCRAGERAAALERMRRGGWFAGAEVHLMLGPSQRQVTVTQRPPVADDELRDALRWQLRDALGYAPEEAVLDPLPVSTAGRAEMMVFASRRSELQAMINDCGKAGIAPARISVIDCAQRNLAWHRFEPQKVVALMMPCTGGVLMTVSRGEELILSRAVDVDLGSSESSQAAERIALQIQRTVDVLERRSADAAVGLIVVAYWGQFAALLKKVAELIGPQTRCVPVDAMSAALQAPPDTTATSASFVTSYPGEVAHLLGACLMETPTALPQPLPRAQAVADVASASPAPSPARAGRSPAFEIPRRGMGSASGSIVPEAAPAVASRAPATSQPREAAPAPEFAIAHSGAADTGLEPVRRREPPVKPLELIP